MNNDLIAKYKITLSELEKEYKKELKMYNDALEEAKEYEVVLEAIRDMKPTSIVDHDLIQQYDKILQHRYDNIRKLRENLNFTDVRVLRCRRIIEALLLKK